MFAFRPWSGRGSALARQACSSFCCATNACAATARCRAGATSVWLTWAGICAYLAAPVRGARHRLRGPGLCLPRLPVRRHRLSRRRDLPGAAVLHHRGQRRRGLGRRPAVGAAGGALAGDRAQLLRHPGRSTCSPMPCRRVPSGRLQSRPADGARALPAAVACSPSPPRSRATISACARPRDPVRRRVLFTRS